MAQLKDTVVSGNLRVTDTVLADVVQTDAIKTHSASGSDTISTGTDGQILKTNGTNTYWGSVTLDNVADGATRKLSDYAPKASPALTGTPTAPTATAGTNTTQIATTAFVTNAVTTATVWEAGTGENSVVVNGCEGVANGIYSTVEGYKSETGGTYTSNTKNFTYDGSNGSYAHAEGAGTIASGGYGSHAEGFRTLASGSASHAEGNRSISSGSTSHAEGVRTISSGSCSHSEGTLTEARGAYSHTEGQETIAKADRSHVEGAYTITFNGVASHAEGIMTRANGTASHSENGNWWLNITSITGSANATSYSCTFDKNSSSHKIVDLYEWLGSTKFISLMKTASIGKANYVQNTCTIEITNVTNVSLSNNVLSCTFTLEKTLSETALSNASDYRITLVGAFGEYSHSENAGVSIGDYSHTDGESYAVGYQSHTEGSVTFALNDYEHAQGKYNKSTKTNSTFGNAGNTLHSIGIGSGCNDRKNAEEIMQNGDMYLIGVGNYNGTNFSEAQTVQQVINGFNDIEEVASAALNDLNDRVTDLESQEIHTKLETSQPAGGFQPNVFYNLGTISGSITFSIAAATDQTIVNHYYWTFDTGSTAPTITWPSGLNWYGGSAPVISASKHYEISIVNNIAISMEV